MNKFSVFKELYEFLNKSPISIQIVKDYKDFIGKLIERDIINSEERLIEICERSKIKASNLVEINNQWEEFCNAVCWYGNEYYFSLDVDQLEDRFYEELNVYLTSNTPKREQLIQLNNFKKDLERLGQGQSYSDKSLDEIFDGPDFIPMIERPGDNTYFLAYKEQIRECENILKKTISKLNRQIDNYLEIVKISDEVLANEGLKSNIIWNRSDTDMLELITALIESKSIKHTAGDITRKEVLQAFSDFLNIEIKDPESKLTRATERKKDISPFLTKLKESFEEYVREKDQRY